MRARILLLAPVGIATLTALDDGCIRLGAAAPDPTLLQNLAAEAIMFRHADDAGARDRLTARASELAMTDLRSSRFISRRRPWRCAGV